MKKYFIAKTLKGKEFIYNRYSMLAIPENKKDELLNSLNERRYDLKDGEVWHIYENDYIKDMYIDKQIKRSKNRIYITSY